MKHHAFWIESFYSSGNIKNSFFRITGQNNEIRLPIPNLNFGGEIPCRFKIIMDEAADEKKVLLDSKTLGESVSGQIYEGILISRGDQMSYSHENEYELDENETTQTAVQKGILEKNALYSKKNDALEGEYDIQIQVFRKYPQEPQLLSDEAPPFLTDYEQKIMTISVYILAIKKSCNIRNNRRLTHSSVYGALGHMGFFMTDLTAFSEFIKKEIGSQPLNLVDLFTSTDLVDRCFEEGILIITWGIKPWHYYIAADNASLDFDDEAIVSGVYKLKNEIKELSVIPGNELINWPSCLEQEWPGISLEGLGEKVSLSLHIKNGELGNELTAAYILQREEGEVETTVPILNYGF